MRGLNKKLGAKSHFFGRPTFRLGPPRSGGVKPKSGGPDKKIEALCAEYHCHPPTSKNVLQPWTRTKLSEFVIQFFEPHLPYNGDFHRLMMLFHVENKTTLKQTAAQISPHKTFDKEHKMHTGDLILEFEPWWKFLDDEYEKITNYITMANRRTEWSKKQTFSDLWVTPVCWMRDELKTISYQVIMYKSSKKHE